MRLLDRLVVRELMGPLLNSIFMFLMLLFTSTYLVKLTDLMTQGVSGALILRIAIFSLPLLITQTLPMGMLLGTILAMGRLSGDSEHIALFASGVSFYRLARPIGFVGIAVGFLAIGWNETVVPPATREFYALFQQATEKTKATSNPMRYDVRKPGSDHIDEIVYIDNGYDSKSKELRKVTILKFSEEFPGLPDAIVTAARARAHDAKGKDWDLFDAYVRYLRPIRNSNMLADQYFNMISTETLPRNITMGKDFAGVLEAEVQDNRRMTFMQLKDRIAEKKSQNDKSYLGDEFDMWSKVSVPMASAIFGLVAAPLGVRPPRSAKAMGFGIAVGLIFVYWFIHNSIYQIAKSGNMSALAAAFTADVLGLAAAIFLMTRTKQ